MNEDCWRYVYSYLTLKDQLQVRVVSKLNKSSFLYDDVIILLYTIKTEPKILNLNLIEGIEENLVDTLACCDRLGSNNSPYLQRLIDKSLKIEIGTLHIVGNAKPKIRGTPCVSKNGFVCNFGLEEGWYLAIVCSSTSIKLGRSKFPSQLYPINLFLGKTNKDTIEFVYKGTLFKFTINDVISEYTHYFLRRDLIYNKELPKDKQEAIRQEIATKYK
jgi:hypothetical protein